MNKLFTALLLILFSITSYSQVYNSRDYKYSNQMNIGKGGSTMVATDSCAMLELGSEGINKALLLPRGDTAGVPTAKRGAIFYNLADSSVYFRTRNKWNKLSTGAGGGGSYTSDNGITLTSSNFSLGGPLAQNTQIYGLHRLQLGALNSLYMDADTLYMGLDGFKFLHTTSNGGGSWQYGNMWMGWKAGEAWGTSSTGYANTGFGRFVHKNLNGTNLTAASNAGFGAGAQENMTTGTLNSSFGVASQGLVTTATGLTTIGHHSGLYSTSADNATFVGRSSGDSCTASETVAIGFYSQHKTYGLYNAGLGAYSGYENTSGNKNTNIGWSAGKNNTTPTENTLVGYLAGGTGIGTSGYNTCIGASSGAAITSGNTNVSVGRASMAALTTGLGNVAIGNNSMNTGNFSNSIVIGRTINVAASNELNLGGALYGANIYSTTPRFALGKVAGTNSTFDMGGCSLPVILPKSSSIPSVGLETAMIYYNQNTNNIDLYDGSWGAIQRKQPFTVVTSSGGLTWNSTITPQVELDATSNAITQTIPAHSTSYTGWVVEFTIVGATSNAVTFNIPSTAMLNGVTGATTFTPSNGNVVRVRNDGARWVITNK